MLLGRDSDTVISELKLKKDDKAVTDELGANRTADERRKLGSAESEILLNLHDAQRVVAALRLHG